MGTKRSNEEKERKREREREERERKYYRIYKETGTEKEEV
jgi:hypothetical protein